MSKYEIKLNPEWDESGYDFLVDAGYAFENGTVFQQSYEMAHTCYSIAAKAGDAQAINNLGWLYENGLGVDKNVEKAISIFEYAAKLGNATAMVNLGNIYEYGLLDSVPDYKKAFSYYKAAAKTGDLKGIFNFANCYHWGCGVRKNYKKAFRLFSYLVTIGYEGAAFYMGLYY